MFINLHTHSHYSLLDGIPTPREYCKKAVEYMQTTLAITDHGSINCWFDFFKAAKEYDLKPIGGCEFYGVKDANIRDNKEKKWHLCLFAKNENGQNNIQKLLNKAYTDHFYKKPTIDRNLLKKYCKDTIATSACLGGEINQLILKNDLAGAKKLIDGFKKVFGDDFYIEIQPLEMEEQIKANLALVELSKFCDVKLIATTDSHYVNVEDSDLHEAVLCMQTKDLMSNPDRWKFNTKMNYFMNDGQIKNAFEKYHPDIPNHIIDKAIENTKELADKCEGLQYDDKFAKQMIPEYPTPEGMNKNDFFKYLCKKGLKKLNLVNDNYIKRMKEEYDVINEHGLIDYFLIVWDAIKWSRENDIRVGYGRGSSAGSLCCHLLDITRIDPIKNELLFTRFISPERADDLPDIDVDFCSEKRNLVIDYVKNKYGRDKVLNIGIYSRLKAKASIKDVSRIYEVPYKDSEYVCNNLIEKKFGSSSYDIDLSDKYTILKESFTHVQEIQWFKKSYRKVVNYAQKLEGKNRNMGSHAAGVAICKYPVGDFCPIVKIKGEETTGFENKHLKKLGITKFDFLGLKTLTLIDKVAKYSDLDIDNIPFEDEKVYEQFSKGNCIGIFQFESRGMREKCKEMKPNDFSSLSVANAIYRPGAFQSGMADAYVEARTNPDFKPLFSNSIVNRILKDTYGLFIYQEDVMFVLKEVGGLTWLEIGHIREIIKHYLGKDAINKYKNSFLKGSIKNGVDEDEAKKIWDIMVKFSGYAFNKAHSYSYTILSYQCMYLKTYATSFFYAELLNLENDQAKVEMYKKDANKNKIKVKVVNINNSGCRWKANCNSIYEGFSAIKGMGEKTSMLIEENAPYKSLEDFYFKMKFKIGYSKMKLLIENYAFVMLDNRSTEDLVEKLEKLDNGYKKEKRLKISESQLRLF